MAELADARDLKSLGPKARPGSTPGLGTNCKNGQPNRGVFKEKPASLGSGRCRFRRQTDAGWSSPVARWAHNPKVAGSNPAPATIMPFGAIRAEGLFFNGTSHERI